MTSDAAELEVLRSQLAVVWRLAGVTLSGLTTEECLWVPSEDAWTVREGPNGRWVADWQEPEPDPVPPTSIAWLQWHVLWWWSTVIDRSFGDGSLRREDVVWPGASESMDAIGRLHDEWLRHLDGLAAADLSSGEMTRWPYDDGRPFAHVVAWVNIELMKNVAEMAYIRRITPFSGASR